METFLLNLLKTSLLGSLAILAMLVLKPLWRERYRAKTRCWLWLALAVFLLLPVDFSVKNAPVQAEPPKDYTLFVGTDKTTIQSTDNLFGDMAEKSGQSPRRGARHDHPAPCDESRAEDDALHPRDDDLVLRLSRGRGGVPVVSGCLLRPLPPHGAPLEERRRPRGLRRDAL